MGTQAQLSIPKYATGTVHIQKPFYAHLPSLPGL